MVLYGALGPDLLPGASRHFAWQAWHLVTFTLVSRGRRGTQLTSTVVLRGRRGTHGTVWRAWPGFVAMGAAPLCVAGVALGHTTHTYSHTHTHTHTSTHLTHKRNSSISNLLTHTRPHITSSTPNLHHLFSLSCLPHAVFVFLLLLVGRS